MKTFFTVLIFELLLSIIVLSNKYAKAAPALPPPVFSCRQFSGHCTPLPCGFGSAISNYGELDCTPIQHCCPNPAIGSNCTQDLAGSCLPFCIYGEVEEATGCLFPTKCCLNPDMENPKQPQTGPLLTDCKSGGKGIETAIGCIPTQQEQGLAKFFLTWGFGIAAGIALVMIVFSGIIISTSRGDPKKLQSGKELLTGAITGLLLLTLSAFILRVVGADILGIF